VHLMEGVFLPLSCLCLSFIPTPNSIWNR